MLVWFCNIAIVVLNLFFVILVLCVKSHNLNNKKKTCLFVKIFQKTHYIVIKCYWVLLYQVFKKPLYTATSMLKDIVWPLNSIKTYQD